MKKQKTVLLLSLFVILMTVFTNVFAQDISLPAFKVSSVVTDEKIVLATKNFPADTAYTVSMASPDDPEHFTAVAKFNSKTGGSLNVTVKIPEKFRGFYEIELMLKDSNGGKILGKFVNDPNAAPSAEEPVTEEPAVEEPAAEEPVSEQPAAEEPAAEEPAPISLMNQEPAAEEPAAEEPAEEEPAPISLMNQEPAAEEPAAEEPAAEEPAPISLLNQEAAAEEPAAEEPFIEKPAAEEPVIEEPAAAEEVQPAEIPVLVCNYAIIPTVKIDAVQRDGSVTFTTANFPADSTFSVSMGEYVSTWVPDMRPIQPVPGPFPFGPHHRPVKPSSKPHHWFPPAPRGHWTSTFSGTEAGTFETGNGEPQTLTFEIPDSAKGKGIIALWIQDLGPCGFYSYNYFYNNTVN